MIVEIDDFYERHHRLDLLVALREANPSFRCTVFAIPYHSPDYFLESLPEWIEVAPFGWRHFHARECAGWSRERSLDVLLACSGRFVNGFKAPGYAISPGLYEALNELDWWVRDRRSNDASRPAGLRMFCGGGGQGVIEPGGGQDRWYGSVGDLVGSFPMLRERVRRAMDFVTVGEASLRWYPDSVPA